MLHGICQTNKQPFFFLCFAITFAFKYNFTMKNDEFSVMINLACFFLEKKIHVNFYFQPSTRLNPLSYHDLNNFWYELTLLAFILSKLISSIDASRMTVVNECGVVSMCNELAIMRVFIIFLSSIDTCAVHDFWLIPPLSQLTVINCEMLFCEFPKKNF